MIRKIVFAVAFSLGFVIGFNAARADAPVAHSLSPALQTMIRVELLKQYPGAKVTVLGQPLHVRGELVAHPTEAEFLGDNSRGLALLRLREVGGGGIQEEEISVSFTARKSVLIAQRRIRPGEHLEPSAFVAREIDLALAPHHDFRGLILGAEADLTRMEANQTLIEGQYPLSSALRLIPDVQRGETIKLRLISGGLVLSTLGTAEEPGNVGNMIRVYSQKTKKQLVGKLLNDRSIEVTL